MVSINPADNTGTTKDSGINNFSQQMNKTKEYLNSIYASGGEGNDITKIDTEAEVLSLNNYLNSLKEFYNKIKEKVAPAEAQELQNLIQEQEDVLENYTNENKQTKASYTQGTVMRTVRDDNSTPNNIGDNLLPVFGLQEEHDINKKDSRYNLTDVSQLDELVYKYQNNRSKLSETEQIHYDNLISNYKDLISQIPSNEICTNLEVRKIFLALKKLDKYDYDSSKFPSLSVGSLDETSKILGVYSEDFSNLESLLSQDELYAEAMRNFYDLIYQSSNFCVLLNDDKNKVAELASKMLDEECAMYGEDKSKIVKIQDHFERSATYISDCDNEWNNWKLQVAIYDKGIDSEGEYLPLDLVALHELYHVKQFAPGIAENSPSDFCEIGASIDTLVRSDEIHKKINGIDISDVVEYPVTLNNSVNLGTLANEFRSIKEKYHFENYEQVLITPEGRNLVIQYFK